MSRKDRVEEAVQRQVGETVHELPEEQRENPVPSKQQRTERLVLRLTPDELRRINRYFEDRHLPVSTGARSMILEGIRRA